MSRKQTQIDNTKQWVLQAYINLLSKRADSDITISAICLEAGVGRQTFYRHFHSKECLVLAAMDGIYDLTCERLQRIDVSKAVDRQVFEIVFQTWSEYPSMTVLINSEVFNKLYLMEVRKLRHYAQQNLGFKRIDNPYAQQFREGGINQVFILWLNNGMKEPPAQMATILVEQCLRESA